MLTFDEERARATPGAPFREAGGSREWMGAWCQHCAHDADLGAVGCALMLVAMCGRTPAAWTPDEPTTPGRQYECGEYTPRGAR